MLLSKTVTSEVCFCSFFLGRGLFFLKKKRGLQQIREGGRLDRSMGTWMIKRKQRVRFGCVCMCECVLQRMMGVKGIVSGLV